MRQDSGQAPFAPFKDFIVMRKVIEGERPERPEGVEGAWFTDDLWATLNLCWATEPENRLSIEAVLGCLERPQRLELGITNGRSERRARGGAGNTASRVVPDSRLRTAGTVPFVSNSEHGDS